MTPDKINALVEAAKTVLADFEESRPDFLGMPIPIRNSSIDALARALSSISAEKQDTMDATEQNPLVGDYECSTETSHRERPGGQREVQATHPSASSEKQATLNNEDRKLLKNGKKLLDQLGAEDLCKDEAVICGRMLNRLSALISQPDRDKVIEECALACVSELTAEEKDQLDVQFGSLLPGSEHFKLGQKRAQNNVRSLKSQDAKP